MSTDGVTPGPIGGGPTAFDLFDEVDEGESDGFARFFVLATNSPSL